MTTTMEFVLAITFVVSLLAMVESGRWLADRHLAHGRDRAIDAGAIQGAMLGLLALLLGFSFGGSASRYVERQDLVVAEASAAHAVALEAGLLPAEDARAVQAALRAFLDHRRDHSMERDGLAAAERQRSDRLLEAIWIRALEVDGLAPEYHVEVLDAVGALIDVAEHRAAASERHLPWAILALLVACSLLTLLVIGYAGRLEGQRRNLMTRALALLIASALLATVDMDHGSIGLIRVSQAPLERLAPLDRQAPLAPEPATDAAIERSGPAGPVDG
ncbi:hypothetical protein HFP89_03720 [Wenzhouxiangella sp. XN79A]|uniref:bestrophin-like domain n=1 Tax=Wenzhouxiangella sp. XN79A TaxID=2724193 RepID=UPI00144AE48E|nr:hypothetical protein [Wenzhouxiangella sp. XN79A]NKI34267.1 hypothetical protein [Wenzhouxiangella sp. XN79A]